MESTFIHTCLKTDGAPTEDGHEVGERWVCSCGDHFVYREGFNRGGYPEVAWWPAPAIPQPRSSGIRLFGPRKG
jgi:hypothetical protein